MQCLDLALVDWNVQYSTDHFHVLIKTTVDVRRGDSDLVQQLFKLRWPLLHEGVYVWHGPVETEEGNKGEDLSTVTLLIPSSSLTHFSISQVEKETTW